MATRMVMITNMVNGMVSVKDPATGVNKMWRKRGQTLPLPYESVENLLWQDGFMRLLESGILYIQNMKDKQDLGLEPQEAKEPTNIIALSELQMKNLMTTTPFTVFKTEIAKLPRIQVDNLIEYAVQNNLTDTQKCYFLKEVTGKDILLAISRREEEARADELERQKQAAYAAEGRRG